MGEEQERSNVKREMRKGKRSRVVKWEKGEVKKDVKREKGNGKREISCIIIFHFNFLFKLAIRFISLPFMFLICVLSFSSFKYPRFFDINNCVSTSATEPSEM